MRARELERSRRDLAVRKTGLLFVCSFWFFKESECSKTAQTRVSVSVYVWGSEERERAANELPDTRQSRGANQIAASLHAQLQDNKLQTDRHSLSRWSAVLAIISGVNSASAILRTMHNALSLHF